MKSRCSKKWEAPCKLGVSCRETTDTKNHPYVPRVFTLSPDGLRIHAVYDGYWYSGRATPEELRQDLRAIQRSVRADFAAPAA